jgi:hypothetical protein
MTVRDCHVQATTQVLAHVERAKASLHHIHGDNLNAHGAFIHPSRQLVSLKVARGVEQGNRAHGADPMDEMTEQKRHEMLKAAIMLCLGGFLVRLATAVFSLSGFHAMPFLFAACGGAFSVPALLAMYEK